MVELSARPLSEALPSKFGQQSLFESPNIGEMTALDAFQESVNLAESGADSDLYDDGFLAICLKMRDVLSHGFDGITVEGKQRKTGINSAKLESISNLRTRLPRPSRTNLVGKLDSVSHTDGHFNLDLPDGTRVRGIPAESIAEELNGFWGQQVFVQGIATFHASGKLSHIDAEMIQNATPGQSAVWSKLPRPLAHAGQQNLLQNQGPRSGLAKIMGRWPGEESDEQIEELLKGIS
ncbi:MAG: hypothetical protein K2W95_07205 [Candidatus Obscuribacterales bacterium]|nr:hypothetical protein [Candidatus Obscuribacterales bacterium]